MSSPTPPCSAVSLALLRALDQRNLLCCLFSSSTGGISDNQMNFPTLGDGSIEEQGDKGNIGGEKDGNRCRLHLVIQQTMYLGTLFSMQLVCP